MSDPLADHSDVDSAPNALGASPSVEDAESRHQPAPSPYEPRGRASTVALTAILLYALFDLLLPLVRIHLHRPRTVAQFFAHIALLELVPTAVFMLLQVWLARCLIALRWSGRSSLAIVLASTVLWFLTLGFIHGSRHMSVPANTILAVVRPTLLGILLTVGLTALGASLSRIIREPNVLLPVALIAMPIDYVGAMTSIGFTNTVVRHAPSVVQAVSVPVPHMGGLQPIALVGPGDALFMAFFFASVVRLGMDLRATFWWMASLLTIAMGIVLLTGLPIAALIPMGIAVIVANRRYFKFRRDEVFAMIYAGVIVFAVIGAFYVLSHRYMMRAERDSSQSAAAQKRSSR